MKYTIWLIKRHKKDLWVIASQIILFVIMYDHLNSTLIYLDDIQIILGSIQLSLLLNLAMGMFYYFFLKESYSEYKKKNNPNVYRSKEKRE